MNLSGWEASRSIDCLAFITVSSIFGSDKLIKCY